MRHESHNGGCRANNQTAFFLIQQQQHVFLPSYPIRLINLAEPTVSLIDLATKPKTNLSSTSILPQHSHTSTMDATTTQVQPLADRSTNTHLANTNVDKTDMKSTDLSSMEYHRQVLQGKQDSGEK